MTKMIIIISGQTRKETIACLSPIRPGLGLRARRPPARYIS